MKYVIGIDASPLLRDSYTGTEWYLYNLITSLTKLPQSNQFTWKLYIPHTGTLPDITLPMNWSFSILRWPFKRFWISGRLSLEMFITPPSLLFVPANKIPFIFPVKTITTIHDIGFVTHPELYSKNDIRSLTQALTNAIKKCKRIICISHATKKILKKYTNISSKYISVIPLAINLDIYKPRTIAHTTEWSTMRRYIIFVGRIGNKKNIETLTCAMEKVVARVGTKDVSCILVGPLGFGGISLLEANGARRPYIIRVPWISEEKLISLIGSARILVLPSKVEGFGLTILEAQALHVPVIASHIEALHETGGSGALYFETNSADELARSITMLLGNKEARESLINYGLQNVKKYSLSTTARLTLTCIEEVLQS